MATLTLRLIKGSTLTFSETDNNFTALNDEKIERDGSIPFTGAQRFIAGTVSAPGITIVGNTNTGIYSPAADQLAITCGGTQRGLFSSSGLTVTGTFFTINSSSSPQLRLERSSSAPNEKNWIIYVDTASLQFRPYADDYSSSTIALSIARSGITAGQINTYNNLYVGANQSGVGQLGVIVGTAARTGFVAFNNSSGGREGYIGFSSTTGGNDTGTIPYVAGTHDFTGKVVIGTPSSGAALSVSTATPADWTSLSSDRIRVGGTTGATNESISVIGATRSELLLGGHANTSTTTHNTIKFISTRRSTTDENAAAVAYITNTLTDGSATTGGGLIFATRPSNGSIASRLEISDNGNVTIYAPVSGTSLYVNGDIYATGTITQGSDERLKTNVKTIEGALDKVSAMRGVSFTRKDTGQRDVGVIAQEVSSVVPEVVHEDENGYLSVAYGNMVGVLIEAIKELRDEVLKLKAKCLF
jgi:hypothetical protein